MEDGDIRTNETDMDEYHPKATRTLFVGNLEKDTTVQDLLDKFSVFGEIIVSIHIFYLPLLYNTASSHIVYVHPSLFMFFFFWSLVVLMNIFGNKTRLKYL